MCFFAGGTRFSEQGFGMSATQLNSSLLTISVIAVLLPAAFHLSSSDTNISTTLEGSDILKVSHGVSDGCEMLKESIIDSITFNC
jgi:Ca2+:H+ antiporter